MLSAKYTVPVTVSTIPTLGLGPALGPGLPEFIPLLYLSPYLTPQLFLGIHPGQLLQLSHAY